MYVVERDVKKDRIHPIKQQSSLWEPSSTCCSCININTLDLGGNRSLVNFWHTFWTNLFKGDGFGSWICILMSWTLVLIIWVAGCQNQWSFLLDPPLIWVKTTFRGLCHYGHPMWSNRIWMTISFLAQFLWSMVKECPSWQICISPGML